MGVFVLVGITCVFVEVEVWLGIIGVSVNVGEFEGVNVGVSDAVCEAVGVKDPVAVPVQVLDGVIVDNCSVSEAVGCVVFVLVAVGEKEGSTLRVKVVEGETFFPLVSEEFTSIMPVQ